jgi:hypothetical protein
MNYLSFIFFLGVILLSAGSVQAQSNTTSGRSESFSTPPPPSSGPTEAFTLKKFRDKTVKKKFKREKPLKTKNRYNPKKAARRARKY